jgi:micrococcal nuclease
MRRTTARMPKKLIIITLVCFIILACSPATELPGLLSQNQSMPQPASIYTEARVTRIVDGDTIHVDIGGEVYKVRYIGINAPEMNHPEHGLEPFAPEATARNRDLVDGKAVRLEKDVSETDRYGRLLRYVWLDGVMVNEVLVREGLARSVSYPPDIKHQPLLREAELEARASRRGLWE